MKQKDLLFILILVLLFLPFFLSDRVYRFYLEFNAEHGLITSFIKFAILASYGEVLGLRIRTGGYDIRGFGLLPRMIVWGILGVFIKAAFVVFSAGGPAILSFLGMKDPASFLAGGFSAMKVVVAFSISLTLNLTFSPVLMTLHRLTDAHIMNSGGSVKCFVTVPDFRSVLAGLDWKMHWGFVLKKTIPLFWIPAHTFTFLLPPEFQILFAAMLGVVLGVILAFAAGTKTDDGNKV
jgi:hypothetical protein